MKSNHIPGYFTKMPVGLGIIATNINTEKSQTGVRDRRGTQSVRNKILQRFPKHVNIASLLKIYLSYYNDHCTSRLLHCLSATVTEPNVRVEQRSAKVLLAQMIQPNQKKQ